MPHAHGYDSTYALRQICKQQSGQWPTPCSVVLPKDRRWSRNGNKLQLSTAGNLRTAFQGLQRRRLRRRRIAAAVGHCLERLDYWLDHWLDYCRIIGWIIGCIIGWIIDWITWWIIGWIIGWIIDWIIRSIIARIIACIIDRLLTGLSAGLSAIGSQFTPSWHWVANKYKWLSLQTTYDVVDEPLMMFSFQIKELKQWKPAKNGSSAAAQVLITALNDLSDVDFSNATRGDFNRFLVHRKGIK